MNGVIIAVAVLTAAPRPPPTLGERFAARHPDATGWHRTQCGGPSGDADLPTSWGKAIDPRWGAPLPEYPRPTLVRGKVADRDAGDPTTWRSLNGMWEWEKATTLDKPPFGRTLGGAILVPFPIESCLSGQAPTTSAAFVNTSWYRLVLSAADQFPASSDGSRLLLHFGAVNWQSVVYVGGKLAGNHTGGYDGFTVEVTEAAARAAAGDDAALEILVGVFNPADKGAQPNGKARISAIDQPGGDTYTPASGIWQSVWLEEVPPSYVSRVRLAANATKVRVAAFVDAQPAAEAAAPPPPPPLEYFVVDASGVTVAKAAGLAGETVDIEFPSPQLWSPDAPYLYDLRITCDACGESVLSYFGMRTFQVANVTAAAAAAAAAYSAFTGALPAGDDIHVGNYTVDEAEAKCDTLGDACKGFTRLGTGGAAAAGGGGATAAPLAKAKCYFKGAIAGLNTNASWRTYVKPANATVRPLLNGAPVFAAGWLDQSYWPDGIYTAPSDEALAFDVRAVRAFGLNTVRLHQKVNAERWYYAADRYGVMVMQDAVQKYGQATNATVPLFEADLVAMIRGRGNHPSIVQWETFNEGDCWRVFTAPGHAVGDIVALAKATDDWAARPVDTDSGGGANDPLKYPFGDVNDIHDYPNPRLVTPTASKYAMIGEFGGVGAFVAGREWVPSKCHTYLKVDTPAQEAEAYINMTASLLQGAVSTGLSASIYTQITDVELECDGFYNYDRTDKFDPPTKARVAAANRKLIEGASRAA